MASSALAEPGKVPVAHDVPGGALVVAFMLGLALLLGAAVPSTAVPVAPASASPGPKAVHSPDVSPLPTPQFRRYGTQDGLPSSVVYAVAQDHDGAIWFGTKGGIARFDGLHLKIFRHIENDPNSLYQNEISTLFVGQQGKVWAGGIIGTLDPGSSPQ